MECLQVFTARDNQLTDLVNLTNTLVTWPALNQLNLTGNPITEKRRYRDSIIVSCQRLGEAHAQYDTLSVAEEEMGLWRNFDQLNL